MTAINIRHFRLRPLVPLSVLVSVMSLVVGRAPMHDRQWIDPVPVYRIFLPGIVDQSARFTDGSDTLILDNSRVRVVIDKRWGGAIREIWFEGENVINNFDGGRLSGVSLYDAHTVPPSGGYDDPNWGWNPTPSDIYDHENRLLAYSLSHAVLYVKARYIQWNPNNKGGGPGAAVPSDILVETWLDLPESAPNAVHVRYRVTHDGDDYHARVPQELGYVYVRPAYARFVRYSGNAPWTGSPVEIDETPPVWPAFGRSVVSEEWGGFVDAADFGLVLWAPQAYPNIGYVLHRRPPPTDNSTAYLNPMTLMEHRPGTVYEFEQYLIAGRWQDARTQIYALRQHLGHIPDVLPGFGNTDLPVADTTVSGVIDVAGWALDDRGIMGVDVLLDGQVMGQAQYGLLREDVVDDYPGFPDEPYVGFWYAFDTTGFADGPHALSVRISDAAGNEAIISPGEIAIILRNGESVARVSHDPYSQK